MCIWPLIGSSLRARTTRLGSCWISLLALNMGPFETDIRFYQMPTQKALYLRHFKLSVGDGTWVQGGAQTRANVGPFILRTLDGAEMDALMQLGLIGPGLWWDIETMYAWANGAIFCKTNLPSRYMSRSFRSSGERRARNRELSRPEKNGNVLLSLLRQVSCQVHVVRVRRAKAELLSLSLAS